MSLPDLVGGGAACGPVNPLQQLGKRFGEDRGAQFDTQRPDAGAPVAGPHGAFRSRPGAPQENPGFFSPMHNEAPFGVAHLREALPNVQAPMPHADMEASFRRIQQGGAPPAMSHKPPAMASGTPAWARDFMGQAPRTAESSSQAAASPRHGAHVGPQYNTATPPMHAWQGMMRAPMHHPMGMQHASMAPQQAEALEHASQSDWDSAFTKWDRLNQEMAPADVAPAETLTSEQVDQMDSDELARTAARLLSSVEHDSDSKFQKSEFLSLMRKLRDWQAEVQGANIVEHGAPAADAKGKAREAPAADAQSGAQRSVPPDVLNRLAQRNGAVQSGQPVGADTMREMEQFYAEEDAAREADKRRVEDTYLGDRGDVEQRMREDNQMYQESLSRDRAQGTEDPYAREFERWTGLGGGVEGATRGGWEEEIASPLQDDGNFVGRDDFFSTAPRGMQRQGPTGPQEREWAKMQQDWDAWDASEAGMRRSRVEEPFPFEAPAYRFHEYNPYLQTTHQHAMHGGTHAPSTLDESVLEREAAVQADPENADAWYSLGVRQQENERETQAIAALRRALDINPRLQDAWLALAVSYTNESDRTEALASIERWIAANDRYQDVVQRLTLKPNAEQDARIAQQLMAMARAGMQQGGDAEAGVDADVQVALGVLFNSNNEYDKAVDCFSAALAARPDDWLLYNRIGATLSNSGRSDEALTYYHQALNLRPGFARCHFNMAISCLNLKMYQDAAEHAYTALTLQQVSQDDETALQEQQNAQSNNLWEILRVSLELMDRPDLARRTVDRNINSILLEEIVG